MKKDDLRKSLNLVESFIGKINEADEDNLVPFADLKNINNEAKQVLDMLNKFSKFINYKLDDNVQLMKYVDSDIKPNIDQMIKVLKQLKLDLEP